MSDADKTKAQLIADLETLRARVKILEQNEFQRQQAVVALRDSEEQFRTLAEFAPTAISILDRDMGEQYLYVNPAWEYLTGFTKADAQWVRPRDIVHPDMREQVLKMAAARLRGEPAPSQYEMHILTKVGSEKWVDFRAVAITYKGKPAILTLADDITERKRAERQHLALIRESERANVLQRFLGDASHDLRTPLTTIKTSLYLLQKLATTERQIQHIRKLKTQTERLEKLLEDMLNMVRLDQSIEFEFETVDLNALIHNIISEPDIKTQSANHIMDFDSNTNIRSVQADRYQLKSAITNILMNALNYTSSNGNITLRTYQNEHKVVIEVQDTGMGIDSSELPYIFDRFYRADSARSTVHGGAGLGLAIAKRIIEAHHGHIEVESEPGRGSIFKVHLPHNA